MDFRKNPSEIIPLAINGTEVERVTFFKFLGVYLSADMKWETNTDFIIKKAQQRLFFLRRLKSFRVSQKLLIILYHATIRHSDWSRAQIQPC